MQTLSDCMDLTLTDRAIIAFALADYEDLLEDRIQEGIALKSDLEQVWEAWRKVMSLPAAAAP